MPVWFPFLALIRRELLETLRRRRAFLFLTLVFGLSLLAVLMDWPDENSMAYMAGLAAQSLMTALLFALMLTGLLLIPGLAGSADATTGRASGGCGATCGSEPVAGLGVKTEGSGARVSRCSATVAVDFAGGGCVRCCTTAGRAGATGAGDGRRLATIGADGIASCRTVAAGQSSRTWKAIEMASARTRLRRPPWMFAERVICKVTGLC